MTAISDKYNALGGSSGFLGAATTSELTNADGVGHHQDFANGTIYWHPALGAWEVHGAIRVRWSALGSDTSVLGYPMTDETSTPDGVGRFNHFQHGSIYWHPRTGAHETCPMIIFRHSILPRRALLTILCRSRRSRRVTRQRAPVLQRSQQPRFSNGLRE
jgi:uncharacterized protein with LGFP repeats